MKYAYMNAATGIAAIVIPAAKSDLEKVLGPLTQQAYVDHVLTRSIPSDATDLIELPDDWDYPDITRYTRNAWVVRNGRVEVDMAKARDVHRDKIRYGRTEKLKELDVEYQRADEENDNRRKQEVVAQKKALRDMTEDPRIEQAQTPEDLIALYPEDFENTMPKRGYEHYKSIIATRKANGKL